MLQLDHFLSTVELFPPLACVDPHTIASSLATHVVAPLGPSAPGPALIIHTPLTEEQRLRVFLQWPSQACGLFYYQLNMFYATCE